MSSNESQDPRNQAQMRMIVDVAFEKFRRYGTRRVTMDEIARDLAISKKTLYQHFDSKEALVWACTRRIQETVFPIIIETMESKASIMERILTMQMVLRKISSMITSEYVTSIKQEFPHIWEDIDQRRQFMISGMEKLFEEGIQTGEIHPEINSKVMRHIVMAIVRNIISPEGFATGDYTISEAVPTILTLLSKGLFTDSEKVEEIFKKIESADLSNPNG